MQPTRSFTTGFEVPSGSTCSAQSTPPARRICGWRNSMRGLRSEASLHDWPRDREQTAVSCAAFAAGCAGHSMKRVNPSADDDVGGTLIDSADVIAATDRAATDLGPKLLQSQHNDLVVAPATIKNESIQPFNTAMLSDRMID